ncbi:hypothetical protein Taro_030348 [Colocasia esculenta]|uniref:Uncharacterized protein n=1 Tax=Colocasia esculenta TaxID=4460 RepID=A0A843VL75_COLES|nr:hypothetical protein [Colocasia esculenta]
MGSRYAQYQAPFPLMALLHTATNASYLFCTFVIADSSDAPVVASNATAAGNPSGPLSEDRGWLPTDVAEEVLAAAMEDKKGICFGNGGGSRGCFAFNRRGPPGTAGNFGLPSRPWLVRCGTVARRLWAPGAPRSSVGTGQTGTALAATPPSNPEAAAAMATTQTPGQRPGVVLHGSITASETFTPDAGGWSDEPTHPSPLWSYERLYVGRPDIAMHPLTQDMPLGHRRYIGRPGFTYDMRYEPRDHIERSLMQDLQRHVQARHISQMMQDVTDHIIHTR